MKHLIDKSAVVAEIERRLGELSQLEKASYEIGLYDAYKIVFSFLDTLEVKEVDLDKEIDLVEDKYHGFESLSRADIIEIAKHFFELGMAVSNERIKDWREKCCGQCKFRAVEYNGKEYPCKFSQCSDEEVLEFDEHNGCQGIRQYLMTGIFPEYARKTKEQ